MTGDMVPIFGIRIACDLVGTHNIERLSRIWILAGVDRTIRHDDRRPIVLEQRRKCSHRRLVARDHGNGAGEPRSTQMLAQGVVRYLASDQRVTHLARSVADTIGYADRVLGLHQSEIQLPRFPANAALELSMDRVDLRHDAEIALAVAFGADDADRGFMDQLWICAERYCKPDGLR